MEHGELFVMGTGGERKPVLHADNWDSMTKVYSASIRVHHILSYTV